MRKTKHIKTNLVLRKRGKSRRIVFVSKDKITEDAQQLIKDLFDIEGALITNESLLEDFVDFSSVVSLEEEKEKLCERIGQKYGVILPEILAGETRIWKVVELIYQKQREAIFSKQREKRLVS